MDGRTPRWADVLAMAQTAESMGFDAIWIAARLQAFAGLGLDHVQVQLRPNSIEGLDAFAPVMEQLRRVRTQTQ